MVVVLSIIFLIILIAACVVTYRTAEVNELHKVRAAFEDKRNVLLKHLKTMTDEDSEKRTEERGEIEGIEDAIDIIDELEHLI